MEIRTTQEILSALQHKTPADNARITEAYNFALEAHKNQKRYSGEPYFLHVAEVGYSLAHIGMDTSTVVAGLLHDVVEDAHISLELIREKFGEDVEHLVDGVTKLGKIRYRRGGMEHHTESLRKLFAATAKDIRVLIVKLMDRRHNALTLSHVPPHKQERIARETLELFAPISDRLGMSVVKIELEDAAFPYAYPKDFEHTRKLLKERSSESEKRLEKMERTLKRVLAEAEIKPFRVEARAKGVYSLFRKLKRKDDDLSKIHDIIALRVIVRDIADCYRALGIVHGQWRPVPGKIKDYIAFPKPNGYQSIHTTVYTGDGGTIEIQIRSEPMHREAQFGIASHLSYKESQGYTTDSRPGSSISWIRSLLPLRRWYGTTTNTSLTTASRYSTEVVPSWVKELAQAHEHNKENTEVIGADFFNYRVFVFTPENDVIDLPLNATPIDFAYAIHSDIGDHVSGATVNGKYVAIDTPLKNGDIVEIITKKSANPTHKWLEIVKTTMARRHIRSALERNKKT